MEEALVEAVIKGDLDTLNVLIAQGKDVNLKDKEGNPLLHLAIENGHVDIVKSLIALGADVNARDKEGKTSLNKAIIYIKSEEIIHILEGAGTNDKLLDYWKDWARVILEKAKHDPQGFSNFLQNLNDQRFSDNTLLYMTIQINELKPALLYIALGVEVNTKNELGMSPLHIAALSGYLEVVNALISAKADLSLYDEFGHTALHCAVIGRHLEVVKALIAAKADVNIKTINNKTPLQSAKTDDIANALKAAGEKQFKELLAKNNIPDMPLNYFENLSPKYYNKLKESLPYIGKMIAADYKANSEPLTDAQFEAYITKFRDYASVCKKFNIEGLLPEISNLILNELGTSHKAIADFRSMVDQKAQENQAKGK